MPGIERFCHSGIVFGYFHFIMVRNGIGNTRHLFHTELLRFYGGNVMKKSTYVMSIVCAGIIAASSGIQAQTQGSEKMMHGSTQQSDKKQNYHSNTRQDMMGGMSMGSGMMGGMGSMMGGMGMGPGMMDGCPGMGMGMMDGMGPMMGGSDGPVMKNFKSSEEFETFLEETKEQRQKLHTMRFEYSEKMRQPETTVGELKQMKKDMYDLMKEIHGKTEKSTKQ